MSSLLIFSSQKYYREPRVGGVKMPQISESEIIAYLKIYTPEDITPKNITVTEFGNALFWDEIL